MNMKQFRKWY